MKFLMLKFGLLICLAFSVFGQTPGTSQYPTALDTNTTLLTTVNNCATTLNGAVDNSQTTFTVVSTTCFPSAGLFVTETEIVIYTAKTATTFTGLTRGAFSSGAAAHNNGIAVRRSILAQDHNVLRDAIIATQTKLGTGSATASNNTVFRGTGPGITDFGQIAVAHIQSGALSGNGSKVGTISGTTSNGKCLEWDANGNIVTAVSNAACGAGGGSSTWNSLTDPGGNLSLAMGANLTTLTWGGNFGSSSAFKIAGANTSATGPLVEFGSGVSNNMPVLELKPRGGRSFRADHLGSLLLGKDSPGNTDTDGYAYFGVIGSNLGPSGTPTSNTGFAPLVLESDGINTEYALWGYMGSAWRDLSGVVKRYDSGSGSGNQTLDFNSSSSANVTRTFTLTGNVTFTAWNNAPRNGSLVTVIIVQDGTGSRTVIWPSNVKWSGGTAPTLTTTANKRDIFQFVWDGSNYYNVSQSLNQ